LVGLSGSVSDRVDGSLKDLAIGGLACHIRMVSARYDVGVGAVPLCIL
jgi:hypothetical protein